jgi:UDP-2,3-diacylglucosamine hydrolase
MSTLFISDLHLEDSRPESAVVLMGFLSGPARSADAVYILGDLFEFWIGDDALSASARAVAQATSELAASGVACYFMHGNRDFMLGQDYAGEARMRLLPETHVADLYGLPTLLLHGDTLCTDDLEYQASVFRWRETRATPVCNTRNPLRWKSWTSMRQRSSARSRRTK